MATCSICTEDLNRPVATQCGHMFCSSCLHPWLTTQKENCPICKQVVRRGTLTRIYGMGKENGEDVDFKEWLVGAVLPAPPAQRRAVAAPQNPNRPVPFQPTNRPVPFERAGPSPGMARLTVRAASNDVFQQLQGLYGRWRFGRALVVPRWVPGAGWVVELPISDAADAAALLRSQSEADFPGVGAFAPPAVENDADGSVAVTFSRKTGVATFGGGVAARAGGVAARQTQAGSGTTSTLGGSSAGSGTAGTRTATSGYTPTVATSQMRTEASESSGQARAAVGSSVRGAREQLEEAQREQRRLARKEERMEQARNASNEMKYQKRVCAALARRRKGDDKCPIPHPSCLPPVAPGFRYGILAEHDKEKAYLTSIYDAVTLWIDNREFLKLPADEKRAFAEGIGDGEYLTGGLTEDQGVRRWAYRVCGINTLAHFTDPDWVGLYYIYEGEVWDAAQAKDGGFKELVKTTALNPPDPHRKTKKKARPAKRKRGSTSDDDLEAP